MLTFQLPEDPAQLQGEPWGDELDEFNNEEHLDVPTECQVPGVLVDKVDLAVCKDQLTHATVDSEDNNTLAYNFHMDHQYSPAAELGPSCASCYHQVFNIGPASESESEQETEQETEQDDDTYCTFGSGQILHLSLRTMVKTMMRTTKFVQCILRIQGSYKERKLASLTLNGSLMIWD